ncbi:MAG: glutamine--fructose-6-phosphate transaminase (isomerizing) [Candidatus Woesearchaeota archaeon]
MCGIIAYVGQKNATEILLSGLKRLEYRGYDSAGIGILSNQEIKVVKAVGKIESLIEKVKNNPIYGNIGIGHTRWATHGKPEERNAHPHLSQNKLVAVVHNGIIENYKEIKDELSSNVFISDTDTEVIAHLVEKYLEKYNDFEEAVIKAIAKIKGQNAFIFMSKLFPDKLILVRLGNAGGLTIGLSDGETFVASDVPAILEYTRKMIFLEDQQIAIITKDKVIIKKLTGEEINPKVHQIQYDFISASKEPYRHFMEKEIFEQPRAILDTLRGRVDFDNNTVNLDTIAISKEYAKKIQKIIIVGCGTSFHAGLVGKFMIESLAKIPVEVDYASEFRYRDLPLNEDVVVLAITQSGETADTLAAMDEARKKGAKVWAIVNAIGSQAQRISDGYILMHAGPEIGVASTKAFTTSLVDLYLLGCYLALQRDEIEKVKDWVKSLLVLPDLVAEVLKKSEIYYNLANRFYNTNNFIYLGRGINYPIALEGALKLKEISYIHAEGIPGGEIKHGPIALIDEKMPVFAIAVKDHLYSKIISQIEQVKARGAKIIAIASEEDNEIESKVDFVIKVPQINYLLNPVINVIPLQLFSYYVALIKGCDVDLPRNLAKSVTVE